MNDNNIIEELKKYATKVNLNDCEKMIVQAYEENLEQYNIGVICETNDNSFYETYIYLSHKDYVIPCLLYKKSWNYDLSLKHFFELKEIVSKKNIKLLLEKCKR